MGPSQQDQGDAVTGKRVGLLGVSALTGAALLARLGKEGWQVAAFSRSPPAEKLRAFPHKEDVDISWYQLGADPAPAMDAWLSTAPIWELPAYFDLLRASGAKRVIAFSSTSRFTKSRSVDPQEQVAAARLAEGEQQLQSWAEREGIQWLILRPTLIYGEGRDHNVSSMLRFIRRFGFLPVLGSARGLRQPIHVEDVARTGVAALESAVANCAYNLSGGETLSFGALCERLFAADGRRPRLIRIPVALFCLVRPLRVLLPQRLRWLVAMMERMNEDLVFDHSATTRDLGVAPRRFVLDGNDLQSRSARILP